MVSYYSNRKVTKTRLISDFLPEYYSPGEKKQHNIFKMLKENTRQTIICYSAEQYFKDEWEIKTFPGKTNKRVKPNTQSNGTKLKQ